MTNFTVSPTQAIAEESLFFDRARPGKPSFRTTATAGGGSYLNDLGAYALTGLMVPPLLRRVPGEKGGLQGISRIEGNTLHIPMLDQFEVYADGHLNGGTVRVSRVDDVTGKLVEVKTTGIVSTNINTVEPCHNISAQIPPGVTSYRWKDASVAREAQTFHFALCNVNGVGERSPYADPINSAWTTPATRAYPPEGWNSANVTEGSSNFRNRVESAALPIPTGLTATPENNGTSVLLQFDASTYPMQIGYSYTSSIERVSNIVVEDATGILLDDLIVLEKVIDHTVPKEQVIHPGVWNAASKKKGLGGIKGLGYFNEEVDYDFAFMEEGRTKFVRITVPTGVTAGIGTATHSHTGQNYYPVFSSAKVYRLYTRIREVTTGVNASAFSDQSNEGNHALTLGAAFQDYNSDFTYPDMTSGPSAMSTGVQFVGPCTVDLECCIFHEADAEPQGVTVQDIADLAAAKMDYIRGHAFVKTNPSTYDLDRFLSYWGPPATRGTAMRPYLEMCKAAGTNPWIQIPWHFSDAELRGLAEYYYTPYDEAAGDTPASKPWAHRRAVEHGQIVPWGQVFPKTMWEKENENWNSL